MSREAINIGIVANDGNGDRIRIAFTKTNNNFIELYDTNSTQNNSINAAFLQANTPSHVSNSASIYANGAFAVANSASIYANGAFAVSNSASIYANGAFVTANASFIRANNSLDANVGGVITGNVTVTNNLTINGTLTPTLTANGNVSAYASKHLVEYNPTTKALTYSSTPDASSPYITGYSQEIHVSPVAFNDSGKGTIGDPVKTIARAIQLISPAFETTAAGQRKTIVLHPGDYAENVTIDTQYTVLTTHELIGKSTTLSGTLTLATGCTVAGLKMTNLVISGTSANGSVDIIGCTVTTSTTKTSSAYTNFRGCDLSSSTLSITGTGTVVMVGGNYFTTTVNNAAASVLAKAVVSMGPVTLTAGTMQIADTLVYAATNTSNAITQSAGSVLTLNNSQTLIPDLSNVARNSFGGFYSILHSVFDKTNSTFSGTSLSAIDYSQHVNVDKLIVGNTSVNVAITSTAISGNATGTFGNTTINGTLTATGNVAGNTAGFAIGYRDIPQNFTNTSFTLALTDAGKHILTQNSGASTQTITIANNTSVAFQTGAAITIVVQSTGTVAVANDVGVTMYLAGNSTAKSTVTLSSYSMATLLKIGTDTWMISGTGAT